MPPRKKPLNTEVAEAVAAAIPVAYSYARYSSRKQAIGSSEERQVDQARDWAHRKGVKLIEEVFDRGKSGYHGEHRKRGAFGRFLADLKSGRVPTGAYLVIEAMNRLSRETPYDAQGTLRELLDGGIVLVVLYRGETEIDRDRVRRDPRILADLHQDIEIAHQQSKEKADMANRNWRRLAKLIQERVGVTGRCPGWLRLVGEERKYGRIVRYGRFERHPENWPVVEEMVQMRMAGHGLTTIARKLNTRGVRPFQDVYNGRQTSGWTDSSVKFVLRHPALYGEFRFQRKVDGILPDPVADYYPPVISEDEWHYLQGLMNATRKTGGGRRRSRVPNIFEGLLRCGICGGPMHLSGDGPHRVYQYKRCGCDHYRRGVPVERIGSTPERCVNEKMWQLPLVEGLLLYYLFDQLDPSDLTSRRPETGPLEIKLRTLKGELAKLEEKMSRGNERLLEEDGQAYRRLQDALDKAESHATDVRIQLRNVEQELAGLTMAPTLAENAKLLQQLRGSLGDLADDHRESLRDALARVVERVEVGMQPIPFMYCDDGRMVSLPGPSKGVPRFPVCTIYLKGGEFFRVTGTPPSPEWQTEVMGWPLPPVPRKYRNMKRGQYDGIEDLDAVGMLDGNSDKRGWLQLQPIAEEPVSGEKSKKKPRSTAREKPSDQMNN